MVVTAAVAVDVTAAAEATGLTGCMRRISRDILWRGSYVVTLFHAAGSRDRGKTTRPCFLLARYKRYTYDGVEIYTKQQGRVQNNNTQQGGEHDKQEQEDSTMIDNIRHHLNRWVVGRLVAQHG